MMIEKVSKTSAAEMGALMAFWHKTRKEWVPLTRDEWFKRGCTDDEVKSALVKRKLVEVKNCGSGNSYIVTYSIAAKGRSVAGGLAHE